MASADPMNFSTNAVPTWRNRMYNYRMVKDGNSFSVMEVWYDDSDKPESFIPLRLSDPIHEDFLNVKCEGCATDKEKDGAARSQIIKELTMIINDLSNDAAPLINKPATN